MSLYFGLLGEKLQHSISPKIHEMFFKMYNIDGCYHLFEIKTKELKTAIEGLKVLGFRGVNVTIPYKTDAMSYIDTLSQEARSIGAINTIVFREGKAAGYNTDYTGFGDMLRSFDVQTAHKKAVVLGTGGSSKAVVQYLMDNGIKEIYLVTRDSKERKEAILSTMPVMSSNLIDYKQLHKLPEMDMLINCTPCGMYPDIEACPVDRSIAVKHDTIIDLIYNPSETPLLKYGRESGSKTMNGLYMLVSQAAAAERIWNTIDISSESVNAIYNAMKQHFD